MEETPTLLGPLERANLNLQWLRLSYYKGTNRVYVSLPLTKSPKSKNPVIPSVIHHLQNPSESARNNMTSIFLLFTGLQM
jgi:hypothetical protein